jgi:hypothetical protein
MADDADRRILGLDRARFIERTLARHESAWRAKSPAALVDAIAFCARVKCPPPEWLVTAFRAVVPHWAKRAKIRRGPGAYNTLQERFDQDMIDYTRWDALTELRERRQELQDVLRKRWGGTSWLKCYAAVADHLAKTPAAGGPDAVKKSYQRVNRNIKKGDVARYIVPSENWGT